RAPQPHGHWVEHFSAAGIKATQLAVLLTVLALLGWRTLSAPLVAALLVVGAGIALQAFGDAQVAGAIWRTTGNPSDADGYKAGHDASDFGDLLVLLGSVGFVLTAGISRRVRPWLAVCAA